MCVKEEREGRKEGKGSTIYRHAEGGSRRPRQRGSPTESTVVQSAARVAATGGGKRTDAEHLTVEDHLEVGPEPSNRSTVRSTERRIGAELSTRISKEIS